MENQNTEVSEVVKIKSPLETYIENQELLSKIQDVLNMQDDDEFHIGHA